MKKPNLNKIIANNLNKTTHIPNKGMSGLPNNGPSKWLEAYDTSNTQFPGADYVDEQHFEYGDWTKKYATGGQQEKICYDENGYRIPCVDETVPIKYTFNKNDRNFKKYNKIKNAEKIYSDFLNEMKRKGVMSEDEFSSMRSKYIPNLMDVSKYKVESPLSIDDQPIFGVVNGKDVINEITDNYDFPVDVEYRYMDPPSLQSSRPQFNPQIKELQQRSINLPTTIQQRFPKGDYDYIFGPANSVIGRNYNGQFYSEDMPEQRGKINQPDLDLLNNQEALKKYVQNKGLKFEDGGWLSQYADEATQFGQYKKGGGMFPEYHSYAPPRHATGGQTDGGLLSRTVTCSNCGWSWKAVDGGIDPMTCHKCGGTIKMKTGGLITQTTTMAPATQDSVKHQANKILQYEQLRGGPGGAPLPQYSNPKYMDMLMGKVYPEVRKIMPNASAMEAGEAMDFVFNAGFDQGTNKITKDPRAFALQEYYRQNDPSKLDADGKWAGRKNAPYSFDQEYNNTIGKLPENQRRILMNKGRDWYYKNINNPAPGVPNSNYNDTWYGRIWNTNDYQPFNPYNPNFIFKKEMGGDISIPDLQEGNWLKAYGPGGQTTDGCPPNFYKNAQGKCVPEYDASGMLKKLRQPVQDNTRPLPFYDPVANTQIKINKENKEKAETAALLIRAGMDEKKAKQTVNLKKLDRYTQKTLDEQKQKEYRTRMSQGYDVNKPIEDQYNLADIKGLDQRLYRGANMLMGEDLGNPVLNVARDIMFGPGKSFVNLSNPNENYIKPGFVQGASNLAMDLFNVAPTMVGGATRSAVNLSKNAINVSKNAIPGMVKGLVKNTKNAAKTFVDLPRAENFKEVIGRLAGIPLKKDIPRMAAQDVKALRQVQDIGRLRATNVPMAEQMKYGLDNNIPEEHFQNVFGMSREKAQQLLDTGFGEQQAARSASIRESIDLTRPPGSRRPNAELNRLRERFNLYTATEEEIIDFARRSNVPEQRLLEYARLRHQRVPGGATDPSTGEYLSGSYEPLNIPRQEISLSNRGVDLDIDRSETVQNLLNDFNTSHNNYLLSPREYNNQIRGRTLIPGQERPRVPLLQELKRNINDQANKFNNKLDIKLEQFLNKNIQNYPYYSGNVQQKVPGLYLSGEQNLKNVSKKVSSAPESIQSGDVFTGSMNTSHSSYLPQLKQVFKYTKGDPQFLGYKPMNDAGFLSGYGYKNIDIVKYLNSEIDEQIKRGSIPKNIQRPFLKKESVILPHYGVKQHKEGGSLPIAKHSGWLSKYDEGGEISPNCDTNALHHPILNPCGYKHKLTPGLLVNTTQPYNSSNFRQQPLANSNSYIQEQQQQKIDNTKRVEDNKLKNKILSQPQLRQARKLSEPEQRQEDERRYELNKQYAKQTGNKFNYKTGDVALKNDKTAKGGDWGNVQTPELIQSFAGLTPSGSEELGNIGANTFVNMNPITGPAASTGRLTQAVLGQNPYGFDNSGISWNNALAGLGVLGDATFAYAGLKPVKTFKPLQKVYNEVAQSMESGLLSNASKLNPFAGTFQGESKLPSFLQLNKLDDSNAYWRLTKDAENYGLGKNAYFNKGVPLTGDLANTFPKGSRAWGHRYSGPKWNPKTGKIDLYDGPDYLFKVGDEKFMEPHLNFPEPHLKFFRQSRDIPEGQSQLFKKDWLQGWKKEVPKPTSSESVGNIFSSKKEPIPNWLLEEMKFKSLPELNNPKASEVLENFRTRIKTPEGQKRLKDLEITDTRILDNLKIVKDENTLGQYWHERIGINPELPEVRNVTRHEIEHGVQDALKQSRLYKYNNDSGNFKYLFRPKAKKEAIELAMKQTSDIDDILGGLELRKTPEKVDWAQLKETQGKKDPSRLFDYMGDKQRATNYFDSGSGGKEKSAFLGEVQQHMMDKGIIPKTSYTEITPEMVKETFIDAMFDEQGGGKFLRLFNIMKPTENNYKLVSKGLNKMLSIAPYAVPAAIGAAALQQKKEGGVTSPQICYDPITGKVIPCKPGAHKTWIFTENPDITAPEDELPRGLTRENAIKNNEFTKEAEDLKNYLIKNQPGEDIEIYPTYRSDKNDRVITTNRGKTLNEILRGSDAKTRLAFMAHHGNNLFGSPAGNLGKKLQATTYDNCYLGSCYSGDIAASNEFKGLSNFYFRPGYGNMYNSPDNKEGLPWFGVNPNKNSQTGEAGVNTAFFNTTYDIDTLNNLYKQVRSVDDKLNDLFKKNNNSNSKIPIDDKRNPFYKDYKSLSAQLEKLESKERTAQKEFVGNPKKGREYEILNPTNGPHIGNSTQWRTLWLGDNEFDDSPRRLESAPILFDNRRISPIRNEVERTSFLEELRQTFVPRQKKGGQINWINKYK